jgi:putative flippase GtrA
MRAVRAPENRTIAGFGLKVLARFGLVGIAATILYAALATALIQRDRGLSPVQASLVAYTAAALFSYLAHKFVTFMSIGSHRSQVPRFIVLTAAGFAVAYAMPALLTLDLGLPPIISVLATCLLIPALNLLVLDRWVFTERKSDQ